MEAEIDISKSNSRRPIALTEEVVYNDNSCKGVGYQGLKERFQEKTGNAWVLRKNAGDADDSNTPIFVSIYALYLSEQVCPTLYSSSSRQRRESA